MREEITDLIDDLEGRVNYVHDCLEKALDLLKKGDADSCSSELEDILENLKELSKELY